MLESLLIVAFGGAFLTYLLGKISPKLRDIFAVVVSLAMIVITCLLYGKHQEIVYFRFFDFPLILRINTFSWFFAISISVLTMLSIIFSLSYMKGKERLDYYYLMMFLVNAGMLGIVLSGDLISFYIFWEIMSWSTFLLISYNKGHALAAGMKYIIMSIVGSVAMFIGILSLYTTCGTFNISKIFTLIAYADSGYILFILIVFGIAFGIKNAVIPFHTWLPDSYADAPSPFTAVLSGMLTRMGIYGFLIIMYVIMGATRVLSLGQGLLKFNYILAWLGAITIVIPTFIAMLQNDAKQLLAWHGIGQGGYMILGIAFGTSFGLAGGIFHTLNHAIYITLLFMSVGAVQYRTRGERNLNNLGGLIKKMPVAFIGALFGIAGLMGVPLTNGFVSKWLIYKTLIIEGAPFLAFAALIGTWGTILSVYKFLHNMFLGQLPEKYKNTQKSPISMQLPIIILSFAILLFGVLPGIPLKVINAIVVSFGFEPLGVNIWGIVSETGMLNTVNIFAAILVALFVVYLFFRGAAKSERVLQEDSYAAGSYIPVEKYHYTVEFYNPFFRGVKPWLKDRVDVFYEWITEIGDKCAEGLRRIYTGDLGYYVIYIILFLAALIFVQIRWRTW